MTRNDEKRLDRNTLLLEHVIQVVDDPTMIHSINLFQPTCIFFNYDLVQFIVYPNGHVKPVSGDIGEINRTKAKQIEDRLSSRDLVNPVRQKYKVA